MQHYCGLDVSNKSTSICVINEAGEIVFEKEVSTKAKQLMQALKGFKELECVVESAPLAERLCEVVEECGHKIDIIDARHAKAVTQTSKKTDRLDAQKLAQVCRVDWYTRVHRKSGKARELRSYLRARQQLVKTMNCLASTIRGILRAHGEVVPKGDGDKFESNVNGILSESSPMVKRSIAPLLKTWKEVRERQKSMYKALDKQVLSKNATSKLLTTAPSIGPATAAAYIATIDDPRRFESGEKIASYLGIVPKVYQSGDTEFHGRITKQGDGMLRTLLVEAATVLLTRYQGECPIKSWGLKLQEQKGFAKARVAVARRLAVTLHKMWLSGKPYDAEYMACAA